MSVLKTLTYYYCVIIIINISLLILKIENMTTEEINALENKVFRLECEQLKWRKFRKVVESFLEMSDTFGGNTESEVKEIREELESIKYY